MINRFAKDDEGAVAVIVALLLVVLLGFTALGVDVASLYGARARLQAVSDVTAMSAIARPEDATTRSEQVIKRNGKAASTLETLEYGRFLRNPAIPPEARFQPLAQGSKGINSVRLKLREDAPLHFAQIFTDETHVALTRTALASRTGGASFTLSSHILDAGLNTINDLLAQQIGLNARINLGDLSRLDETRVDQSAVLGAAGVNVGRNPAEILNATVTGAQLVFALQSVLPAALAAQLDPLRSGLGTTPFDVGSIAGGIDTDLGLTATDFLSGADVSALDFVRALLAENGAGQTVDIGTDINLAGIISTQTTVTAGEPPVNSGRIAIGEDGVQLHRAAVRLKSETALDASLLGGLAGGVEIAKINVPIYVEVAGATATLEELSCNATAPQDVAARFSTAPAPLHPANGTSLAALYLGRLPDTAGPINPAQLDFADLVDVNLSIKLPLLPAIRIEGVTVQARAHVRVGTSRTEHVTFTHADIANARSRNAEREIVFNKISKSFGSGNLLSSAVGDLLSPQSTELRIKPDQEGLVAGLAAPLMSAFMALLPGQVLAGLLSPLDAVLDTALATAGLELGSGELTLTGHHCEPVRLVN